MSDQKTATDFYFWGRTHVHGTHVLESCVDAVRGWTGHGPEAVSITIFKPVLSQGHFVRYADKAAMAERRSEHNAELCVTAGGEKVHVGLVCDGGEIDTVVPDDEPSLVEGVAVDVEDKSVSLPFPGRERLFTRLVAMNKSLLRNLLDMDGYTPWVLVRFSLDMRGVGGQHDRATVRLANNAGNMMTRSRILFDENVVGDIQFSRKQKA